MTNIQTMFPDCLATIDQNSQCCYGSFRLMGCVTKISRRGEPYWSIQIADVSGTKTVLLFDSAPAWDKFPFNSVIFLDVELRSKNGFFVAKNPRPLSFEQAVATPILFWKAVPMSWIVCDWVAARFLQLLMSIQSPSLLAFITIVFWQSYVLEAFFKAPASLNYHHNYPGGLLAHSVEVAEIASSLPLRAQLDRDILVTAALLHDIGKMKTLNQNMTRTALGKLVDHDEMTLEICSHALSWLDNEDANTGMLLRHIWTCSSPGARYGYKPITYLAPALQLADRMSSMVNINA